MCAGVLQVARVRHDARWPVATGEPALLLATIGRAGVETKLTTDTQIVRFEAS